jgi:F0F1-type ATP synthase beta subunit
LPDDFANRIGRLIETRGDVVDALFNPAALPDLLTELTVSDEARKDGLKVHLMQRPGGGVVRGLAASALPPLPKGATVLSSRRRSQGAIDPMQLDRLVPLPAAATSEGRLTDEVAETGIKVIDVPDPRWRQRRDRRRVRRRHHGRDGKRSCGVSAETSIE